MHGRMDEMNDHAVVVGAVSRAKCGCSYIWMTTQSMHGETRTSSHLAGETLWSSVKSYDFEPRHVPYTVQDRKETCLCLWYSLFACKSSRGPC